MATSVTFNGTVYSIPSIGDNDWGAAVSSYLTAIASGALQKTGGAFTLTADVDFGASKGLKASYYVTKSSTPATAGQFRLGNAETGISWRNAANDGDLALTVDSSDQLTYNGVVLSGSSALTASRAMVTDASGYASAATTTASEIGFVNGVTSAIQTQLNRKFPTYNVVSYGATGDGVTDDTTAINDAIAAATGGGVIYFPAGTYQCNSDVTIAVENVKLFGDGKASIIQLADGQKVTCSASNVWIDSLTIDGQDYSTGTNTSRLLNFVGASSAAYLENIKVTNCYLLNAPYYGIFAKFCENLVIANNTIDTVYYAGVAISSCDYTAVSKNIIRNILGAVSGNSYGVFFSRTTGATEEDDPRCHHALCDGNIVQNNPTWEALDTHSGEDITFSNNTISECKYGIVATAASDGFAPQRIVISGNIVNGVEDGSYAYGINVTGDSSVAGSPTELSEGCIISSNSVSGFGAQASTGGCALRIAATRGAIVSNNVITEPSPYGVILDSDNYAFNISGNTCIDPWSNDVNEACFIKIRADYQYGVISDNAIRTGDKSATYVLTMGIRNGTTLNNSNLTIGNHTYNGTAGTFTSGLPAYLATSVTNRYPQRKSTTAAPSTGTWNKGDIVFQDDPDVNDPIGWMCTVAGSPGTWVAMPLLTAPYTASRVLVTDGSSVPTASSVTSTTLGYLDVGSSLTTLLAAKAPLASPTFTGTVSLPSGSASSTAWTTGSSTFTAGGIGLFSARTNFGSSSTWLTTDTAITVYKSADSNSAPAIGIDAFSEFTSTNAYTAGKHNAGTFTIRRNAGSVTDTQTSGFSALETEVRLLPNSSTYTYTQTAGYAGIRVRGMVIGTGTSAITNSYGIKVEADSGASGTNKYGLYIDTISGATNNYGIVQIGSSTSNEFQGTCTIGNGTSQTHRLNAVVGTTVGAAGGGSALPATPEGYITININGTNRKIPYYAT